MKNRTCTATVLDNKTFATLKDIKWTGINQKKSTRQRTTSHFRLVRRQVLSPCCPWTQSSVKAALLRQSVGRVPGCHWPAVSAPPPRDGAPPPPCSSRQDEGSGWGRCCRARTPPAPSPRRFLRTAGIQKQTNQKKNPESTQRHSERRSSVFHFWRRQLPRPKCATGSISHRYPEPPSMMRVWTPLCLVKAVTVAPRAKEPNWVRGTTRSQLLDEPWWEFTLYFSPQTFAANMASVLRALFRRLVPTWLHFEKQLWLANQSGELWLERECSMCRSTRP